MCTLSATDTASYINQLGQTNANAMPASHRLAYKADPNHCQFRQRWQCSGYITEHERYRPVQ